MTAKIKTIVPLLLIIIITSALYAFSFNNNFVWDDLSLILSNPKIHHLSQIPKLFFTDFFGMESIDGPNIGGYYRPLTMVTFGLDWQFLGANPFGYHLVNLFLHCTNTLFAFILIFKLLRSYSVAFFASLLFAIHPLQVDSVAYISGRTDLLATTFILGGVLIAIGKDQKLSIWLMTLACYFGALLSKEIGIILPPLLFLYYWLIAKNKFHRVLLKMVPFAIVTALYFMIRYLVLHLGSAEPSNLFHEMHWRVLTSLWAWAKSMVLFVWPSPIYFERFEPYSPHWKPEFFIVIGLILILFAGLILLFKKNKNLFLFASLFMLGLLPVIGIFPLYVQDTLFWTEHFFYLPSIGLFTLAAFVLIKGAPLFKKNGVLSSCFVISLIFFFSFFTYNRILEWKNEGTLFSKAIQYNPKSARAQNNLGLFYERTGKIKQAILHLEKAIEINPNSPGAYNNLGGLYAREKIWDKAEEYYRKAISTGANTSTLYNNYAQLFIDQGKINAAEQVYQFGIERVKNPYDLYNHLGMFYVRQKRDLEAVIMFQKAIESKPDFTLALNNLGILLAQKKQYEHAEKLFKKALFWNSKQPETYNNLGNLYLLWEKFPLAEKSYKRALELAPFYDDPKKGLKALEKVQKS